MYKLTSVTVMSILIARTFIPAEIVNADWPTATLGAEYSKVMNGSTFVVNVRINVPATVRMYCVNVQISATGGFSVLTGTQYFSSLFSSKTVAFKVKAPSSAASGTITGRVTYSSISSCAGTMSVITPFGIGVSSASPWVLKLAVNNILCTPPMVLSGDPGAYAVSSKSKSFFTGTGQVRSPFYATVNLHPTQDTYDVTFQYSCLLPLPPAPAKYPWAKTKTVAVTGSGQMVYFP